MLILLTWSRAHSCAGEEARSLEDVDRPASPLDALGLSLGELHDVAVEGVLQARQSRPHLREFEARRSSRSALT